MLRSVVGKTLYDQRRALIAWSVSLALLVAMYVAIWPSIRDQPSMSDLMDQMPEAMRSLFALGGADLSTPVGYVKIELLSFMGPMLLLIYAIGAGGAAIAGEEDRHTLDLLLAAPISRSRLVLEKLAAMVLGVTLLATVLWLAMLAEGSLVSMELPPGDVAAAMLHLALLALVFGSLALALGAAGVGPGLSRAIPAVLAVLAYIVNGLGPVVSWLEPLQPLSPFYQYAGHDPLVTGVSIAAVAVAVATIVVLAGAAVATFRRRDLAV